VVVAKTIVKTPTNINFIGESKMKLRNLLAVTELLSLNCVVNANNNPQKKVPPTVAIIPSNAISSGDLDNSTKWIEAHDGGTPGTSKGTTNYPAKLGYSDSREFDMTYTHRAGERWANGFARKDPNSTHFVLDTWIYLPNPSEVMNLEIDVNQVLANGETVILGTQCAGINGYWGYAFTGPLKNEDHWMETKVKCNPAKWTANVWHHLQIGMHRDAAAGGVTHDFIVFDGVYNALPAATSTLISAHFLDWTAGQIETQFQIEGSNLIGGRATAYIHNLTVYRW
jgi:hypothetical protein